MSSNDDRHHCPSTGIPPILAEPASPVLVAHSLHPSTVFFAAAASIRNFALPILIALFVGRNPSTAMFFAIFPVLAFFQSTIKYFRFRYSIGHDELMTQEGLLERSERQIPFKRIQDVRIEQTVFHRALNVANVSIETAGGNGVEASLKVLPLERANALRHAIAVFKQQQTTEEKHDTPNSQRNTNERELHSVSTKDLILAGLTSNGVIYLLAATAALGGQMEHLIPADAWEETLRNIVTKTEGTFQLKATPPWLLIGLGVFIFGCLAMVISVVRTLSLYNNFTLSISAGELRRRYGWFTRRSASVPRKRIQIVRINESLARRLIKRATVQVDTAGFHPTENQSASDGRDVVSPLTEKESAFKLASKLLDSLWTDGILQQWNQVAPCMISRQNIRSFVLLLGTTSAVCLINWNAWYGLILLLQIPLSVLANKAHKHLGYSQSGQLLAIRQGWLSRSTNLIPLKNIQTIILRQSPFDRRHGVGTILVDTPGQSPHNPPPTLTNVPWETLLERSQSIASAASAKANDSEQSTQPTQNNSQPRHSPSTTPPLGTSW